MKSNMKKRKPVPKKSEKEKQQAQQAIQKDLLDTYRQQLNDLGARKKLEEIVNKRSLEINLGKDVCFGQEIQFMHYQSQQFLNGKIICSSVDQSAYKFELSSLSRLGGNLGDGDASLGILELRLQLTRLSFVFPPFPLALLAQSLESRFQSLAVLGDARGVMTIRRAL